MNLKEMAERIRLSQQACKPIKTLNETVLEELFLDYGSLKPVPNKPRNYEIHIHGTTLLHVRLFADYVEIKRGTTHKLVMKVDHPDMDQKLQEFLRSSIPNSEGN